MRYALCLLVWGCLLTQSSCEKETEAVQHHPANQPSTARSSRAEPSTNTEPASGAPGQGAAFTRSPGEIEIQIEDSERQLPVTGAGGSSQGNYLLSVKVKVTSRREKVLPLVEPRRFFLETAEGLKISPRMSGRKEPTLGVKYLENGTSLSGWLTFQVPEKAKKLILKADFEQPPLSLPVPSPKNAQDP